MKMRQFLGILAAVLVAVVMPGCGGGGSDGDDDQPAVANSVIQGNVVSFESSLAKDLDGLAAILKVYIRDTDYEGEVSLDADRRFVIAGLPAGQYTVVFEWGPDLVTYDVWVGERTLVILNDVAIAEDGTVTVGYVTSQVIPDAIGTPVQDDNSIVGTWSGAVSGTSEGAKAVTFAFYNDGCLRVRPTDGCGRGIYSINANSVSGMFDAGERVSFSANIGGNSMSGSWSGEEGRSGTFSLTRQ